MHTDPAQPRSPPTPSPRHLQSRANTGLLVIALFSLLGMLVYFLWAGYREAVRDAEVTTRNLVQVIESRVHSDIARIDGILDFIAKEIPPEQLNQPAVVAQQVAMSARMQSLLAKFPGVAVVNIFDAGGYLRYSSSAATLPFSIADRPFFKQLQDDVRIDLVFSDAIISRSTGQRSLILLRSIRDEDRKLLGSVSAVIILNEFAVLLDDLDVGPGGVKLLRRSDNFKLILRSPRLNEKDFNQPLPAGNVIVQRIKAGNNSGTLSLTASTDGVRRTASFIKLKDYPFYIQVALADADILANWRGQAVGAGILAAILLLALSFASVRLSRKEAQVAAAQYQLIISKQRMELALRGGDLGLWDWHVPSGTVIFNERWCSMLGYRLDEILPHVDSWAKLTHPDDAAMIKFALEAHLKRDTTTYECEHRLRHKDGHWVWILARGQVVERDAAGVAQRAVGTHMDISARKQAEQDIAASNQRLITLLDSLEASVYVADIQTHEVLFINRQLRQLVGDVVGQPCWKALQAGMTGPCDFCTNPRLLAADGTVNDTCIWENFNPAQGRWFQRHDRAIPWSDGRLVRMEVALDITARKQAEAALQEKSDELSRSNSELEQFSYSISHDMRQPLRMISSYLQLLQMSLGEQLDAERREYFNFAIDGAKRLDAMLTGLLEFSRVGRKGEPPAWLESRAVIDDALLFLRPAIAESGARVRIEGEWPRLLASPDEMLRLLQNLVANAIKFRVAGRTPEVLISGEIVDERWRLCVTDNGIGMPPDQIGRLFQVFQRLQSRADFEGTGIGLALCRKIVEHHAGRIWAESLGEGAGSRFCFEMPLSVEETE